MAFLHNPLDKIVVSFRCLADRENVADTSLSLRMSRSEEYTDDRAVVKGEGTKAAPSPPESSGCSPKPR